MTRQFLSYDGACQIMQISKPTLARIVRAGHLPVISVSPRRVLIDAADLDAYLASRKIRRGGALSDDDPAVTGSHARPPGAGDAEHDPD